MYRRRQEAQAGGCTPTSADPTARLIIRAPGGSFRTMMLVIENEHNLKTLHSASPSSGTPSLSAGFVWGFPHRPLRPGSLLCIIA